MLAPARCAVPPFALVAVLAWLAATAPAAELRIPAFTGYTLPDPEGARFSEDRGVTRWTNPTNTVNWYGRFATSGPVSARLELRLPEGQSTTLQLSAAGQTRKVTLMGGVTPVIADFGEFTLPSTGYHRFQLTSLNPAGESAGDLTALLLSGPAAENAHFNLKERRNAASVHLMYPVPSGTNIAAFYTEVTAIEDPVTTFYMACGWHRGYFGMQVNSPTERRIIFSVWDSGNEAVDRDKVGDENRVKLVDKGEDVFTGDFGNEGTGGHSHLKFPWKTGESQRFLVTAQPTNGTFTIFSGYYFRHDLDRWMLISSWRAPKEGGWLKRPHSFSENFWGSTGHLVRKARYGNQWIRTPEGTWIELTHAGFSHDPTGKADRLDRFMGVENGEFFLSHGGFIEGSTPYGTLFDRPAVGTPPRSLPDLPEVRP